MQKFLKGSEWRKWDLHIHTPFSYLNNGFGDDLDQYVKQLFLKAIEHQISVIGITDYFCIEGYKKIKKEYLENNDKLSELFNEEEILKLKEIKLLPNIEFRLNKLIGPNNDRVNFHVIFSDNIDINDIEENFLHELEFVYEGNTFDHDEKRKLKLTNLEQLGRKLIQEQPELGSNELFVGMKCAVVDDSQIMKILNKNIFKNNYLIVVPSDEDLSRIDWKSQDHNIRKVLIQKSNYLFSSNKNTKKWGLGYFNRSKEEYIQEFKSLKPCIWGSDAHTYDKLFEPDLKRYTWIKADPIFEGLKQVIIEPEDRIFIGEEPEIFEKIKNSKTKYLKKLYINSVDDYKEQNGVWFKNVNIEINPELVAIIGNKGSGKSAISDIIALCGEYQDHKNFSFLQNKKFRKKGYADKFNATLKWLSGSESLKNLYDEPSEEEPKVKYLPQGDFENLTNEIEKAEKFQREIEGIIFSHLDASEKLGFDNFQDLLSYHNKIINEAISHIKNEIFILNDDIIKLEKKLLPDYKKNLESKIKQKEEELKALEEPQKVENPNDNPEIFKANEEINKKILSLTSKIEEYNKQIDENLKDKEKTIKEITDLNNIKQSIELRKIELDKFKQSKKMELERYGLDIEKIINIEVDFNEIENLIGEKNQVIVNIDILLNGEEDKKGLYQLKKDTREELDREKNKLDEPQKKYQKYLEELKNWKQQKATIEGDEKTPDTLNYYKKHLEYIQNQLKNDIEQLKQNRLDKVKDIFDKKVNIKEIYEKFKQGISKKIDENKDLLKEYNINIDTSLVMDNNFTDEFCKFIDKGKKGSFSTKEGCEIEIKKIIDGKNFNIFDDIEKILNEIENSLWEDKRENIKSNDTKRHIEEQIKNVKLFYDYLFSLDYIKLNYELKLGNKSLEQLSPGERGALLLIFYLLLDKNDIPLILDQPEDNLDNHTVANVLVPFIKRAKKKRQIILVTHNPNLAVVADAEQIIWVNIDKKNKNTFEYVSGSIENKEINEKIVNVLEGAIPAFNKRKDKYYIN